MHPLLRDIGVLQARRARPRVDLSIAETIDRTAIDATRVHRRLGELIQLWQTLLPAEVVEHTALTGLRQGVLHVVVDSAATAFEVDRLLRTGTEQELRRQFRGTLTRIRTRVEPLEDASNSRAQDGKRPRSRHGRERGNRLRQIK